MVYQFTDGFKQPNPHWFPNWLVKLIALEENSQLRVENEKLKSKIQQLEFQLKHSQLLLQANQETSTKASEIKPKASPAKVSYPVPELDESPPKPVICTPKKDKVSESANLPFTPLNLTVGTSPIGSTRKRKAWTINSSPCDKENLREQILASSPAVSKVLCRPII